MKLTNEQKKKAATAAGVTVGIGAYLAYGAFLLDKRKRLCSEAVSGVQRLQNRMDNGEFSSSDDRCVGDARVQIQYLRRRAEECNGIPQAQQLLQEIENFEALYLK